MTPRALTLHGALDGVSAADLRQRVEAAGFRPFWIADRGRYHLNDSHAEPDLFAHLAALAADALAVAPLVPGPSVWIRSVAGDYAMVKDDGLRLPTLAPHVEVSLDFSAAGSDEGQLVWQDPTDAFMLPQRPGAAMAVDRRRVAVRWERYLPARVGEMVLHRLRLVLFVS